MTRSDSNFLPAGKTPESKVLRIALALWLVVWALLWLKPFVKDPFLARKYVLLAQSDFEGRRAVIYGKDFYRFLQFCSAKLPAGSRFDIVGVEYTSIDRARAVYYLYPSLLSESPRFRLVYKTPHFSAENTMRYASLDEASFILQVLPSLR